MTNNNNDLNSFFSGDLSRNELLSWINSVTKLNLTKVQQLGTGIAYCQIMDILHPKLVPGTKMNQKAKLEYQFINNYKLLQQGFLKLGIYKNIEIEKLVKCKYQDNLEFLQWFQKYFEHQISRKDTSSHSISRQNSIKRSVPKRTSSLLIPTNISKIEGKMIEVASFQDAILDDLVKPNQGNSFQQLSQFYKSKLFQIQQLVQTWDSQRISGDLRDQINEILLRPPPLVDVPIEIDQPKNGE